VRKLRFQEWHRKLEVDNYRTVRISKERREAEEEAAARIWEEKKG